MLPRSPFLGSLSSFCPPNSPHPRTALAQFAFAVRGEETVHHVGGLLLHVGQHERHIPAQNITDRPGSVSLGPSVFVFHRFATGGDRHFAGRTPLADRLCQMCQKSLQIQQEYNYISRRRGLYTFSSCKASGAFVKKRPKAGSRQFVRRPFRGLPVCRGISCPAG